MKTTLSKLEALPVAELIAIKHVQAFKHVTAGEWNAEDFEFWFEARLNYAFGDGYDEGYSMAEGFVAEKVGLLPEQIVASQPYLN